MDFRICHAISYGRFDLCITVIYNLSLVISLLDGPLQTYPYFQLDFNLVYLDFYDRFHVQVSNRYGTLFKAITLCLLLAADQHFSLQPFFIGIAL